MSLGEKLLELRKAKHLSQEEAADKLNVTRQTISKWETDQSTPDFDKIMPICELYGISSNELLSGEKIEKEEVIDYRKLRINRAKGISLGILFFFIAISFITVSVAYIGMDPVLAASIFLLLIGVGVFTIVYTSIKNKITKQEECTCANRNNIKINKQLESVLSLFFVIIYLALSFLTGRWDITWLIWIIYACVLEIIKLIMLCKGEEVIDDED